MEWCVGFNLKVANLNSNRYAGNHNKFRNILCNKKWYQLKLFPLFLEENSADHWCTRKPRINKCHLLNLHYNVVSVFLQSRDFIPYCRLIYYHNIHCSVSHYIIRKTIPFLYRPTPYIFPPILSPQRARNFVQVVASRLAEEENAASSSRAKVDASKAEMRIKTLEAELDALRSEKDKDITALEATHHEQVKRPLN